LKKLDPDPTALLRLVEGWRDHAMKVGRMITRIVLAFEAGRDGFWLARWLRARSIEPFVIHSTSVAVSREHRRAKTDRLDTEMLIRVFLGWLRGEPRHCKMVAIPTLEEEDARRPSRERESLIGERTRIINRMKWCGCWQASSVLVSRQRICWCRRSCRETFEIDGSLRRPHRVARRERGQTT
jgi:transposase